MTFVIHNFSIFQNGILGKGWHYYCCCTFLSHVTFFDIIIEFSIAPEKSWAMLCIKTKIWNHYQLRLRSSIPGWTLRKKFNVNSRPQQRSNNLMSIFSRSPVELVASQYPPLCVYVSFYRAFFSSYSSLFSIFMLSDSIYSIVRKV